MARARNTKVERVAREHLVLGCEAESRCDWLDAVAEYRQVLALEPTGKRLLYFGHNNLAYSLLLLGQFDEAELHCRTAIAIDDDYHNAHKNLGLALQGLERPAEAAASFLEATIRCRADERAWLHLRKLLLKYPNLLGEHPTLAERVEGVRRRYEESGGVPRLH